MLLTLARRGAAAVALTGAVLAVGAVPAIAAAAPPATTDVVFGVVRINKANHTIGTVKAHYRCTGTAKQVHLWVSVKQTADRTPDPALMKEGSSQVAAAWSQSHAGAPVCDSQFHTMRFRVDQKEQGFGKLAGGWAWVQFCLFDATTPGSGPTGEPVSSMTFLPVRMAQ